MLSNYPPRITNFHMGFPGGSDGKGSACNAGDLGSTPGSGGSLEKELVTHSSFLGWRIPWTEEPGGLLSMGLKELDVTGQLTLLLLKLFCYLAPTDQVKSHLLCYNACRITCGEYYDNLPHSHSSFLCHQPNFACENHAFPMWEEA